jgi:hypothetical protein
MSTWQSLVLLGSNRNNSGGTSIAYGMRRTDFSWNQGLTPIVSFNCYRFCGRLFMNGNIEKGLRWMKHIMFLWLAYVGFKAFFGLFLNDAGKSVAEAIVLLVWAFLVTGIPAFIIGWLTGKDIEHKPYKNNASIEMALSPSAEKDRIEGMSPIDENQTDIPIVASQKILHF